MNDDDLTGLLTEYVPTARRRQRVIGVAFVSVAVLLPLAVLLLPAAGAKLSDRASTAAVLLTAAAFAVTAWQFRAQRAEIASEAYFARLNVPNERRLAFFEQVLAISDRVDQVTVASALEQHYVFYVFAELDNLEYVARKFEDGHTSRELTARAVRAFESRCAQSSDFRTTAQQVVGRSGYEPRFVALVEALMARCAVAAQAGAADAVAGRYRNPMRYEELEIVRRLRSCSPGENAERRANG